MFDYIKKSFEMYKFFITSFFIIASFFIAKDAFAMDVPILFLIVSENSSGYVCTGDSIGCSSLSSIYKIEKRGEDLYICPGDSIGGCSLLDSIYKTSNYNQDTTYICLSNSFGNCSTFNFLYKISKHDESTNYVCSGDSFGNCSIFNVLYKISKHDADTTFVCTGNVIGDCSIFNVLYKFKKISTQSSEGDYIIDLERQKKEFDDLKLKSLQDDVARAQATVDSIKSAILNPDTALMYSQAGITLNDSVATINAKLADYAYREEKRVHTNSMAVKGYQIISPSMIDGKKEEDLIRWKDSKGYEVIYWKPSATNSLYEKYKTETTNSHPNDTISNSKNNINKIVKEELKTQLQSKEEQKTATTTRIKQEMKEVITNESTTTLPSAEIKEKNVTAQEKQNFFSKIIGSIKGILSKIFK